MERNLALNNSDAEPKNIPVVIPLRKSLEKNSSLSLVKIEENENLAEKLEAISEEIIKLYYQMEESIFKTGSVSKDLEKNLAVLKELSSAYKRLLNLPDPDAIDLPEKFIEEYSILILRAKNVIEQTNHQMEKLMGVEGATLFLKESKRRLETLTTLSSHYKRALGLIRESNSFE